MNLLEQAACAKKASKVLRTLSNEKRNEILNKYADSLLESSEKVLQANALDCKAAKEAGMQEGMLDRLFLDEARIKDIAEGVKQVAALPDPLGQVLLERTLQSGVRLKKISCPIGVIGIIFESRPNVSADCMALCLKSGNACVLKGGKESYESCKALVDAMKEVLDACDVCKDVVMLGARPTHEETQKFMEDDEHVDLLIPRGSKRLIDAVVASAKVPVIKTGAGVCHVFVDSSADLEMAQNIIVNAKCSRPSVCNAIETLLIHKDIAQNFVPHIVNVLDEHHVSPIHACKIAHELCPEKSVLADESSWSTEYDALEINLRVVDSVEQAIDHIEKYGTHHSECIISETDNNVAAFMAGCDSACVYHNASTRFSDGFEFGLGAEIGISTQKLHARGPMGLQELTTYAYHLEGSGQVR